MACKSIPRRFKGIENLLFLYILERLSYTCLAGLNWQNRESISFLSEIQLAQKSSIPFRLPRSPPHPMEIEDMAETCEISLKSLPTRSLRKQVKSFLRGEEVSVRDISGQIYQVDLKRNKLVLIPEEFLVSHNTDGERGHLSYYPA